MAASNLIHGLSRRTLARTGGSALLAGCLTMAGHSALAAEPFAGLTGTWRGSAEVHFTGGASQSLRCHAYYNPKSSGSELGLAIRCATAGNKIELRAKLAHTGGEVSGQWEERAYNASGAVSGRSTGSTLRLTIDGGLFKGSMNVETNGNQQTVKIRATGSSLSAVNIQLSRS